AVHLRCPPTDRHQRRVPAKAARSAATSAARGAARPADVESRPLGLLPSLAALPANPATITRRLCRYDEPARPRHFPHKSRRAPAPTGGTANSRSPSHKVPIFESTTTQRVLLGRVLRATSAFMSCGHIGDGF